MEVLFDHADRATVLHTGELPVEPLVRLVGHNGQVQRLEGHPKMEKIGFQPGTTDLDAAVVEHPIVSHHPLHFGRIETDGQAEEQQIYKEHLADQQEVLEPFSN